MPASLNDVMQNGGHYHELLQGLANRAARYRSDSGDGNGAVADLLAVLAGPETDLLEELEVRLTHPADRQAINLVRQSFVKNTDAFRDRLLRKYPGLFHSQGAD